MKFEEFKKLIEPLDQEVTLENVVDTVIQIMKQANTIRDLSGRDKKILVIEFISDVVEATDNPWDDLLPSIIDGLVDTSKGKLKIKKFTCLECLSFGTRGLPYRL